MGLWVVVAFVAILVAVAGVDETLRLFAYIDLQLRYAWIQFRMERMRRKLRKQLGLRLLLPRKSTMADEAVFKMDRVECPKCGAV